MTPTENPVDVSAWYGPHYFRSYRNAPYERSTKWQAMFAVVADGLIREIAPRTVLDVGCAMGFLVEALRDRGVDAQGMDVSEHAVNSVREDIKPYCRVASITEPVTGRYDLVFCYEVIEHLPASEAEAAIGRLCSVSDDILFSSTPDEYGEDTHVNVRPPGYWAGLFAKNGFIRDLDFDGSAFLAPWACRFRRNTEPQHRIAAEYERRLWELTHEVHALRTRALQTASLLAQQDAELRAQTDVLRLEETIAEQQEHLDALNDRLTYMSDHEAELRRLLIDAHEQILERDTLVHSQSVQPMQQLLNERTAWAQRAVAELEECRKVALERHALVEERTAWAQKAIAELEALRQSRSPLHAVWRRLRPRTR